MALQTVWCIAAEVFPTSSAPPTASSFGALDSRPGGLRADLLRRQRLLYLLQGVYRERRGYSGGTFVADQYGAGLFWIPLELYLHLTRRFAAQVPAFSCVNGDDVYHPWCAPCHHRRRRQAEPWHGGVGAGF